MATCAYIIRNSAGQITRVILSEELDDEIDIGTDPSESFSAIYDIESPREFKSLLDLLTPVMVEVK